MLTLVLGGARSGKSALAVDIARRHPGPVTYVATAEALDDDMGERIGRHRAERPAHWTTIEEPLDLARALTDATAPGTLVIVDCLTLWTANLIFAERRDDEIVALAGHGAELASRSSGDVIAISNEVGLGVHPDNDLGRRYRDLHGWVNQRWAAVADESFLLVAGKLLRLEDPTDAVGARHNDDST